MPSITDNPTLRRFELDVDGQTAFLNYRQTPDAVNLIHTEVPGSLRGGGVGNQLVTGVLERLRAEGTRIIPTCPFVKALLARHPEYAGMVLGG